MNELTKTETSHLLELETVIERGQKTFVEVGNALSEIRESRLYREHFATFEDYCRERWGWERRHAYRLIDAAAVSENVSHGTQTAPASERQARPLAKLDTPEQQQAAWAVAQEDAEDEGKPLTAKHVERAASDVAEAVKSVPESTGEDVQAIPPEPATPEKIIEAVKDARKSKPHVSHNSGKNEWYTPADIIEKSRMVMGTIDLDPASCKQANKVVKATRFYSEKENGLVQQWAGNVWMNPPYAQPLMNQFAAALVERLDTIEQAMVLVNNATETAWFQSMAKECTAICFPSSRVKFLDPDGNPGAPLQGQAILYFGKYTEEFREQFSELGVVWFA
jgi:hypothetical protein